MTNFENYNMETFISEVMFEIGRILPEKYKDVNVRKVNKTNVVKTGMTLSNPENGISPTIYLDDFYEKAASMTIPQIAKEIVDTFVYYIENIPEEMRDAAIAAQKFLNFDNVKDKLILSVISASRNAELLMDVPHKLVGDMAIIYKILANSEPGQFATANVKHDMLAAWGKTFDELYPWVKENSQRLLGSTYISMDEFLRQEMDMPTALFEEDSEEPDLFPPFMIPMYIISNKTKMLGAAAIFYGDELSIIAEKIQSDLFILPSSIHEVIAIPVLDGNEDDAQTFLQMVKDVNTGTVHPRDQLTDEVYLYHREDGSITVVATDCVAAA